MRLNFVKLDPSGNITILVTSPVLRSEQADVAARLMRGDVARVEAEGGADALRGAEQVGFLEAPALPGARARLQMMGGEFCGNASMSLAALLAQGDGLAVGAEAECALEVSGADGPVLCRIERRGAVEFLGAASMPLPEGFDEIALPGGLRAPLVRFPGICHALAPEGALAPAAAEARISSLCAALGADALGILLTGAGGASIRPLVYVRATDSAVWERCCGSGAAALAAHAALRAERDAEMRIAQPGGTITARARWTDGGIGQIEISGSVRLVARGAVSIE